MNAGRLRIVHVITEAHLMGGAQLNTFYSLRWQAHHHTVELVSGNDGPLIEACREAGVPAVIIPLRNRLLNPLGDVVSLVRLTRHFRAVRPDVVHTHSSKAGVLGRVAARLAGVPVVVHTVHGPSYHPRQPVPVRAALRFVETSLARITDSLICVAQTMADDLVGDGVCPPQRVRVVVSGLDLQRLEAAHPDSRDHVRVEFGIPPEGTVVVSVGHLFADKGHDLLIEAAPNIPDATFLIVGEGPMRADLTERIAALGLGDRVLLCGQRDDVPNILRAADIAVQTSWREGLSRSLLEAMYAGLPAIATDVGATREVVRDGVNGYLFRPGDRDALVDRLGTLVRDPGLARSMAAAARGTVAADRSIEAMGHALDALYADLLAGGTERTPVAVMAHDG